MKHSYLIAVWVLFLILACGGCSPAGDSAPSTATAPEKQPTIKSCQQYRAMLEFAMQESDGGMRGAELMCRLQSRANCFRYVELIRERVSLIEQMFALFRKDCGHFAGDGDIKEIIERLPQYQKRLDETKAQIANGRSRRSVLPCSWYANDRAMSSASITIMAHHPIIAWRLHDDPLAREVMATVPATSHTNPIPKRASVSGRVSVGMTALVGIK